MPDYLPDVGPVELILDPQGRYGLYVHALGDVGIEQSNGTIISITFQRVTIQDSPVVLYFDPPLSGVDQISLPAVVAFLVGQIKNGAIVRN